MTTSGLTLEQLTKVFDLIILFKERALYLQIIYAKITDPIYSLDEY